MTDRYAVIGHPVAHSLSPWIHTAFARQTAEPVLYERIEAPLDGFVATVSGFLEGGGRGCNVTVPFKGEAAHWVTELDPQAEFAAAVNTIVPLPGGGYRGYNTDGPGLVKDLQRSIGGRARCRVLLLGAGGAARGVARPLVESIAGELVIGNRTATRAQALAARIAAVSPVAVAAIALEDLTGPFDLVINATSAGLRDQVPEIDPSVVRGALCYDMVYASEKGRATAFCHWSLAAGAAGISDGLGMLVEQAALAFELWRGVLPDSEAVLGELRREFGG